MALTSKEEEIFLSADKLSAEQRAAYLNEVCAGDAELRQRIEKRFTLASPEGRRPLPFLERPPERIGPYKIIQEIGQGGCGAVYLAQQEQPIRRQVALKIIKLGMNTKEVVARFEAERQALAMMDHPNIAKVLDCGADEIGRPFFVMEFVPGLKITDYCDQNRLETEERLKLFKQVCHAIQHAHQKGIIHRDIKPSNILVTARDGAPMPKVIDFGIAKAVEFRLTDQAAVTVVGQFIGTPAYMSPEQAGMNNLDIDTRTDIYSLGVLLYELLTGRTPFDVAESMQSGVEAWRETVRETDPLRPSTRLKALSGDELATIAKRRAAEPIRFVKFLRGDLDSIVMKCLEKDRTRRYETANGLAKEMERFLNHEPVLARPPSTVYRVQKFVRRNKAVVAASAAVQFFILACLVAAISFFWLERRAVRENKGLLAVREKALQTEKQLREAAQDSAEEARRRAYFADMHLAKAALEEFDFGQAQDLLERHRPAPGQTDLRGWEWRYLWRISRSDELATLGTHAERVLATAFSHDGKLLATGDAAGEVRVWDLSSRREMWKFQASRSYVRDLAFHPHKDWLATASGDGKLKIWDLVARTETASVAHPGSLRALQFLNDGKQLVTQCFDGTIRFWSLDGMKKVEEMRSTRLTSGYLANGMAISRDGKRIAIASDFKVELFDLPARSSLARWSGTRQWGPLAFSPDSNVLVAADWDGKLDVRNAVTGAAITNFTAHDYWIASVLFSPDGKTLVTAASDQSIRLWDAATWKFQAAFKGHRDELGGVAFSPDGSLLASGAKDGEVKLWDFHRRNLESESFSDPSPLPPNAIRFASADSKYVALLMRGGKLRVLETARFKAVHEMEIPKDVTAVAVSSGAKWIALGGASGTVELRETHPGSKSSVVSAGADRVQRLDFSANNQRLLIQGGSDEIRVCSVPELRTIFHRSVPGSRASRPLISPDGVWVAALIGPRQFQLINSTNGDVSDVVTPHKENLWSAAFSPESNLFATAGADAHVRFWDVGSCRKVGEVRTGLHGSRGVCFLPNGRVAAANDDGHITLWGVKTLQKILSVPLASRLTLIGDLQMIDDDTLQCNCEGALVLLRAAPLSQADAGGAAQR